MPPEPFDLDAQATTPLAPEALAAMLPLLEGRHWNPHSVHRGGRQTKAVLEASRMRIAMALDRPAEGNSGGLIFTSGATEANNLALKGLLEARPGRLVTFATEHSCVLETARHLERQGVPVTILPVTAKGLPDLAALEATLADRETPATLVSCMAVNNEIGSIAPLAEVARLAHAAGALFHTDAAQAFTKIDLSADADLISITAHKLHGPKGIGALWVRPGVKLAPLLDGGGQEADIRSGTQAPYLAAGFAAAVTAADSAATRAHCEELMRLALDELARVPHRINGPDPLGPDRWPGNLSVTFPGVDASQLIAKLPDLALSSGSACSSGSGRPSHVLAAISLPQTEARQTLRLGWSRMTDARNFHAALAKLVENVEDMQA